MLEPTMFGVFFLLANPGRGLTWSGCYLVGWWFGNSENSLNHIPKATRKPLLQPIAKPSQAAPKSILNPGASWTLCRAQKPGQRPQPPSLEPIGCGCQNRFGIPFWLVGEFTTHFRTYFSGCTSILDFSVVGLGPVRWGLCDLGFDPLGPIFCRFTPFPSLLWQLTGWPDASRPRRRSWCCAGARRGGTTVHSAGRKAIRWF